MTFRSEVALASIAAAVISCGTSRTVDRSQEHVAVAGQPLSLSDDGSGKGDITIDLSGLSFVECSASAGGSTPASDAASAQVAGISTGILSGSLRLHVKVDQQVCQSSDGG